MKPRINCISLAVDDLARSLTFYRQGLGLATEQATELAADADHLPLAMPGNLYLVLILRAGFAEFTTMARQTAAEPGISECILTYFAASKEDVDSILSRVEAAGGSVASQAREHPWGYAGFFVDPDKHLWEIMWNPNLPGERSE